jgi:hypothetical protein
MLEPTGPQHQREDASKRKLEIMEWLSAQYEAVDALFGNFLRLDQSFWEWIMNCLEKRSGNIGKHRS